MIDFIFGLAIGFCVGVIYDIIRTKRKYFDKDQGGNKMNAIYKYELSEEKVQWVSLPVNSTVLSVVEQHQDIVMYAVVDVEQENTQEIQFLLLGTGQDFDNTLDGYTFLNTVNLSGGSLMFHVFVEN